MNFPIQLVGKRQPRSTTTLVDDTFGPSSSLIVGEFFRARTRYAIEPAADTTWVKGSADWQIDSSQLQNLLATDAYQAEAGMGIVIDTTSITETGLDSLTLNLTYTLGDASESLYVHLWGVVKTGDPLVETGTELSANDIIAHLGYRQDGLLQDYTFQNDTGLPDVLLVYNLFTGFTDVGNPKVTPDHGLTFTGSTTPQEHSSVVSLAGHDVDGLDQYDYVFLGFSRDVAGPSSSVVIDNVKLTY